MLSSADAALVARDRQVPALGLVLDPEALAAWIVGRAPALAGWITPRYLRYKPGTSCLAGCDLEAATGRLRITAKALRLPATDKLQKVRRLARRPGTTILLDEAAGLAVTVFPADPRLAVLAPLWAGRAGALIGEAVPDLAGGDARLHLLSYKPERRAVFRADLGGARVVVRAYAGGELARRSPEPPAAPRDRQRLGRVLGRHPRWPFVVTEWVDGVDGRVAFAQPALAESIGRALAELHGTSTGGWGLRTVDDERASLGPAARAVADLAPSLAARVGHLAGAIGDRLDGRGRVTPIHGDFAFRQVICSAGGPVFADLDEMTAGDPAADLGAVLADSDALVAMGEVGARAAQAATDALLTGYGDCDPRAVDAHHAAALIRLATHPFRHRHPEWPRVLAAIVDRADALLRRSPARAASARSATSPPTPQGDPAMPWLAAALDTAQMTLHVRALPWAGSAAVVTTAEVRRHKPGRRCLVHYQVECSDGRLVEALGKTHWRGLDLRTARLMAALDDGPFGRGADDGIRVPPYLGAVEGLRLWLQQWVAGPTAAACVALGVPALGGRLADAVVKLQRLGPAPSRTHTLHDEVRILDERLRALAFERAALAPRIARLRERCLELAAGVPDVPLVPAHRDFHPDQVVVGAGDMYLLDLDLYALSHPALDASNCAAHFLELAVRAEVPGPLEETAGELLDAMERRLPRPARAGVQPLVTLALARLVGIADRLEPRRPYVERILGLCERRLEAATAGRQVAVP